MKYNPEIHDRNSIRLKGYDYYSDGFYFVTICTHKRQCLFGEIVNDEMVLNEYGKIIAEEWIKSSEIRQEIELDEWIVMPNHFHAIIAIAHQPPVRANGCSPLSNPSAFVHSMRFGNASGLSRASFQCHRVFLRYFSLQPHCTCRRILHINHSF